MDLPHCLELTMTAPCAVLVSGPPEVGEDHAGQVLEAPGPLRRSGGGDQGRWEHRLAGVWELL